MEKRWIANPNVKEVDFLDIRIEKTERAIKQAFMELRAEKPLEKIRVKELCDRACINKSTFYAHYQDIYALANAMEDEMVHAVVESLLSRMTGGVHLHTLRCPDRASFERIRAELDRQGLLYRRE